MPSAASLLHAWEQGWAQPLPLRGATLLEAAHPDRSAAGWAAEPVIRRDALLLELREALFGSRMTCHMPCPACSERFDFTLETSDLRSDMVLSDERFELHSEGCAVTFRLPSSLDLLDVQIQDDQEADVAVRTLLMRCIEEVVCGGEAVPPDGLPEPVAAAVAARMDEIGRDASVELSFDCSACGHHWAAPFDIASYLWIEVDAWARRTFQEIHLLASAYGWTESEILGLTARRRRLYAEMVQ